MNEIFKDIPSYEGVYQVSNLGRVKSFIGREKFLKPINKGGGYMRVVLKKKKFYVHRLVANVFLNYNFDNNDYVIDHIDNNPSNNRLDNLQLITHRENCSKDKVGYTSKYVGVSWDDNNKKYHANIYFNGKTKWLGMFNCEKKAAQHYKKALNCIEKGKIEDIAVHYKKTSSKYKGVYWSKIRSKWISRVLINGKLKHLGCFKNEKVAFAYRLYKIEELKL